MPLAGPSHCRGPRSADGWFFPAEAPPERVSLHAVYEASAGRHWRTAVQDGALASRLFVVRLPAAVGVPGGADFGRVRCRQWRRAVQAFCWSPGRLPDPSGELARISKLLPLRTTMNTCKFKGGGKSGNAGA